MSRTAVLAVRILADGSQARREFDRTGEAATGFGSTVKKMTVPALAVVGGLGLIAKSAIASASALQQSTGAVQSVFGKYAAGITKTAQGAATSVGLATSQYQNLAVVLGSQLKNLGTPMDQVAGQTDTLIKRGADLAATFGGSTADAVEAVSSLLRGERDPIERYGVSINDATIKAYEAAHGLTNLTGAAKKQADTQATLALLTKQTAAATGQFARETNTVAGSQEIARAKLENTKAALGQALLPAVAAVTTAFASMGGWVARHIKLVSVFAAVLGVAAVAVLATSAAMKVASIVQGVYAVLTGRAAATTGLQTLALGFQKVALGISTAAQWLFNAAMSANPLAIVVIAIIALVAAIVLAYRHSETFRAIVTAAFDAVKAAISTVVNFVTTTVPNAFLAIGRGLHTAWDTAVAFLRTWGPVALAVLVPFIGIPLLIFQHFDKIKAWLASAFGSAVSAVRGKVGEIVGFVTGLPGQIAGVAGKMLSAGAHLIGSLFTGIGNAIRGAGGAIMDVVGNMVHAIGRAINNLLNLPWVIRVKIPIPGAPDIHFGPYTVLPAINAAALEAPPNLADLQPGFTLMAAGPPPGWSSAGWSQTVNAGAGTSVVINFNGVVTDPDGVAREIERLLDSRSRRLRNG